MDIVENLLKKVSKIIETNSSAKKIMEMSGELYLWLVYRLDVCELRNVRLLDWTLVLNSYKPLAIYDSTWNLIVNHCLG